MSSTRKLPPRMLLHRYEGMASLCSFSAFTDDLGTTFVELITGDSHNNYRKFCVHKKLLLSRCDSLSAKLQPGLFGANEQILLTEEQPIVIEFLVEYLYKDRVANFDLAHSLLDSTYKPPPKFELPDIEYYPGVNTANLPRDCNPPAWLLAAFKDEDEKQERLRDINIRREWRKMYSKLFLKRTIPATSEINLYQTTLLRLCFLAEKLEWAGLFNAAIRAYIEGEAFLQRAILVDHVQMVYENTVIGCSLRRMALDSTAHGQSMGEADMDGYIPLAQGNADLMRDVFDRLKGPGHEFETVLEASEEGVYDMEEKVQARKESSKPLMLTAP